MASVEKWTAFFLVRRQFWFITDGRTRRAEGDRNGDRPLHPREMILLLSAYLIMTAAHASIHVSSLKIWEQMMHWITPSRLFWLLFPHFHPIPPHAPRFFILLYNSLLSYWLCLWIRSTSLLSPCSLLFLYVLHLHLHLAHSVPGVRRTSGAARGVSAQQHSHYAAQGVPMVGNGQMSFTMEIRLHEQRKKKICRVIILPQFFPHLYYISVNFSSLDRCDASLNSLSGYKRKPKN